MGSYFLLLGALGVHWIWPHFYINLSASYVVKECKFIPPTPNLVGTGGLVFQFLLDYFPTPPSTRQLLSCRLFAEGSVPAPWLHVGHCSFPATPEHSNPSPCSLLSALSPGRLCFSSDTSLLVPHEGSHCCCLRLGPARPLCFYLGYPLRFICLPWSTNILCNRKAQTLEVSVIPLCCLAWFPPVYQPALSSVGYPVPLLCALHILLSRQSVSQFFGLAKIQPSRWHPPLSHLDLFSCKWSSSLFPLVHRSVLAFYDTVLYMMISWSLRAGMISFFIFLDYSLIIQ